jgi:hypothetical protein
MPAPGRIPDLREGHCPLCGHNVVVEVRRVTFGVATLAVTYHPRWLLAGTDPLQPQGLIKFYVCRQCGLAQSFVDNPGSIPIGEEYETRLINGPEEQDRGPYR